MWSRLAGALDRAQVNVRPATMILFGAFSALENSSPELSRSRSIILRQRKKLRKITTASITETFSLQNALIVHCVH